MYSVSYEFQDAASSDLIIEATDVVNLYCNVTVTQAQTSKQQRISVGVNQSALEPDYVITNTDLLFFGIEEAVLVSNLKTGKIINIEKKLTGVQTIEEFNRLFVASCEDQIVCFKETGETSWREFLPDVIEDIEEADGVLSILLMDENTVRLALEDGKIV